MAKNMLEKIKGIMELAFQKLELVTWQLSVE